LMEAEVAEQIGAELGERAPGARSAQRNGYRERGWDTRVGEIELAIPKLRSGAISRAFWSRAGARSRRWSRSSRRPMSTASPRARSIGWSSRWACT
jgi:transposase-like protein